jgi:hypothetical protein
MFQFDANQPQPDWELLAHQNSQMSYTSTPAALPTARGFNFEGTVSTTRPVPLFALQPCALNASFEAAGGASSCAPKPATATAATANAATSSSAASCAVESMSDANDEIKTPPPVVRRSKRVCAQTKATRASIQEEVQRDSIQRDNNPFKQFALDMTTIPFRYWGRWSPDSDWEDSYSQIITRISEFLNTVIVIRQTRYEIRACPSDLTWLLGQLQKIHARQEAEIGELDFLFSELRSILT